MSTSCWLRKAAPAEECSGASYANGLWAGEQQHASTDAAAMAPSRRKRYCHPATPNRPSSASRAAAIGAPITCQQNNYRSESTEGALDSTMGCQRHWQGWMLPVDICTCTEGALEGCSVPVRRLCWLKHSCTTGRAPCLQGSVTCRC